MSFADLYRISEGDVRAGFTRFKDENLSHNFAIVSAFISVAERIGCTPGQLSLAWVGSLGPHVITLPGSSYVYAILLVARTTMLIDFVLRVCALQEALSDSGEFASW